MICWFTNSSNDINNNAQAVYLLSSFSKTSGFFIEENLNFRDSISLFIARNRSIILATNYITHDDVYLAPKQLY